MAVTRTQGSRGRRLTDGNRGVSMGERSRSSQRGQRWFQRARGRLASGESCDGGRQGKGRRWWWWRRCGAPGVFIFVVEGLRGMADLGDKLDRQGGAR